MRIEPLSFTDHAGQTTKHEMVKVPDRYTTHSQDGFSTAIIFIHRKNR